MERNKLEKYTILSVEEQTYGSGTGLKIAFVNSANENKFIVVFSNNALYEQVSKFKSADVVEMEFKQQGKYLNLVKIGEIIKATEESKTTVNTTAKQYSKYTEEEKQSIQRQTSIKSAVELVIGCGIKFKTVNAAYQEVIQVAKGFNDFISGIKITEEEGFNDFNSDIKIAEEEV
jgi:hypothetical protein